ncbi:MAG: hypothetical protein ACREXP_30485, partial [Steroidobacteraceae bacterium]
TAITRGLILQAAKAFSHRFIPPAIARDRDTLDRVRASRRSRLFSETGAGVSTNPPSPSAMPASLHDSTQPAPVSPYILNAGQLVSDAIEASRRFRVTITLDDSVSRDFYMTGLHAMVTLRAHCLFENPLTVVIEPCATNGEETCDSRLNTSGEDT